MPWSETAAAAGLRKTVDGVQVTAKHRNGKQKSKGQRRVGLQSAVQTALSAAARLFFAGKLRRHRCSFGVRSIIVASYDGSVALSAADCTEQGAVCGVRLFLQRKRAAAASVRGGWAAIPGKKQRGTALLRRAARGAHRAHPALVEWRARWYTISICKGGCTI